MCELRASDFSAIVLFFFVGTVVSMLIRIRVLCMKLFDCGFPSLLKNW